HERQDRNRSERFGLGRDAEQRIRGHPAPRLLVEPTDRVLVDDATVLQDQPDRAADLPGIDVLCMKRSMRASRAGAKRGWVCAGRRADATESSATARSRVRSMRDLNGFLAQRRTGNFGAAPLVLGVGSCSSPNPAGLQLMVASTVVSQILTRWAHLYGRTPVSATLTYLHLVGILVGGGV